MEKSKEINKPYGRALGDCWSVINYFINLGLERNEIIRLSLWYAKGEKIKRADKFTEILPLLEHDDLVELGEWEATEDKIHWTMGYKYSFIRTKKKWMPNNSKKICYQFDGKSHKAKNFRSKEVENSVLSDMRENGYETVQIGFNNTLEECMNIASECELFVGIDSGMCYLAASAGIPIIFCKNERHHSIWETAHSNKHFILADSDVELDNCIKDYSEYGLKYYLDNARNIELFKDNKNV